MNDDAPDWSDPALVMIQSAALAGFLHWAAGQDYVWANFIAETGIAKPSTPKTGLDRMIDDATGYTEMVLRRFVAWVIPAMWGTADEVPPDMRGLLTVGAA